MWEWLGCLGFKVFVVICVYLGGIVVKRIRML